MWSYHDKWWPLSQIWAIFSSQIILCCIDLHMTDLTIALSIVGGVCSKPRQELWRIIVMNCRCRIYNYIMNSLKLVIPLQFISWKKTPNDAVTPQRQGQFTPKMKANVVPRLLSSLVWIDHHNQCNGMTSFMEFTNSYTVTQVFVNHLSCWVISWFISVNQQLSINHWWLLVNHQSCWVISFILFPSITSQFCQSLVTSSHLLVIPCLMSIISLYVNH